MFYRVLGYLWLLVLLLSACGKEEKQSESTKAPTKPILLTGEITGASKPVVYLLSSAEFTELNGQDGLIDSAFLGPEGSFSIAFEADKANFYKLKVGDDKLLGGLQTDLFLEPGDTLMIKTDINDPKATFEIQGNNHSPHQFTFDELNFFERDLFQSAKQSSLYGVKPLAAAQFNNGLKVERTKFFSSYFAGKYVHGEFERYYIKKNVYEHANRAYKYLLVSDLSKKAKTRILFTDLAAFSLKEVEKSSDYLLFIQSYREFLLHRVWNKIHFELSIEPDTTFERLGYAYLLNAIKKEYKGASLEMALFESRKVMPYFWHRREFYLQISEIKSLLTEPKTNAGKRIINFVERLEQMAPGKMMRFEPLIAVDGSEKQISDFYTDDYSLIIYQKVEPGFKPINLSRGKKVLHLHLISSEAELELWKKEALRNYSKDYKFAALIGESAQNFKSRNCLSLPVIAFQMKGLTIDRSFIKIDEPEKYEFKNVSIID